MQKNIEKKDISTGQTHYKILIKNSGAKEQKGGQKTGAVDAAQAAVNSFIATASVKRDIARF